MNKYFKKIAVAGAALSLTVSAFGQASSMSQWQFSPLISGFNLLVQSNLLGSTGTYYGGLTYGAALGTSNVWYTAYNGQVVESYQTVTNVAGGSNTNIVAPDAMKIVTLQPDINGDINANASLWVIYGNTNYLPVLATNTIGQYFVTNWPLASSQFPNWMYPGTTNFYPKFDTAQTNTVTITLYKSPTMAMQGGAVSSTLQPAVPFWESASTFTASFTQTGGNTQGVLVTNIPIAWLQSARLIYANINLPANESTNLASGGVLINQIGILYPVH